MTTKTKALEEVHRFWNTEACGTHFVSDAISRRDFYEKFTEFRYRTEWQIPELAPFTECRGKDVLEIGCGNGADAVSFAKNGANYHGVDLTDAAVNSTKGHFETLGLQGKVQVGSVESLEIEDQTKDLVYSWGVLHHTESLDNALRELHRVLRNRGKLFIMMYHKNSFNYYFRILTVMRLRVFLKILSRFGSWDKDRRELSSDVQGVRGNENRAVWQIHYENFLRMGWSYLSADVFVHRCTDGPECPIANVYTTQELTEILQRNGFQVTETHVRHFPMRKYRWGSWIPLSFERYVSHLMGWNLIVRAEKMGASAHS